MHKFCGEFHVYLTQTVPFIYDFIVIVGFWPSIRLLDVDTVNSVISFKGCCCCILGRLSFELM